MYSESVQKELSLVDERIRRKISRRVGDILALAEGYRYLGNGFTFAGIGTDEDAVMQLLVKLSDEVYQDAETSALKAVGETDGKDESDTIVAWARMNGGTQESLDKYASHLKYMLEGWLAIGFVNHLSQGELLTKIMTYLDDPYSSPLWRTAFRMGRDYAAEIIRTGGYTWGAGTPISPAKGMTIVYQSLVNDAYNEGVRTGYLNNGIKYYAVHRGSTFDCGRCDDLCAVIHPVTERCLPAHPRCMCWTSPVTEEPE